MEQLQDMYDIEWEPLKEYSRYEINRKGQIRNVNSKRILNGGIVHYGYVIVNLTYDVHKSHARTLHVLVAKQFIPNPENKPFVNHIDEDRTNCAVENLEWVTTQENASHGRRNAKISEIKSQPINEYDINGKYIRTWVSGRAFSQYYGIVTSGVPKCLKGKIPSIVGRQIRYYEGNIDDLTTKIRNYRSVGYYSKYENLQEIPPEFLYEHRSKTKKEVFFEAIERLLTTKPSLSTTMKSMETIKSYAEYLENETEKYKEQNTILKTLLDSEKEKRKIEISDKKKVRRG